MTDVLKVLEAERDSLERRLKGLTAAIRAIQGDFGSKVGSRRRKISADARKRMSEGAKKARLAAKAATA